MGLDITAYTRLSKVENPEMEDGYPKDWENQFYASPSSIDFTEENWPGRSRGVEKGAVYKFDKALRFRAGSYSGYNAWRDWLALVGGYGTAKNVWDNDLSEGPFIELINFADNEGVIGPEVAAKLAKDFADYQDKVGEHGWESQQYAKWREAFELAAQGGAVDFH